MTNQIPTLRFERRACPRCGGCGQYSYCEMYGSTCFKCHGKGEILTKRGHAAANWMREQRSIPATQVTVGMRVNEGGYKFTVREIEHKAAFDFVSPFDGKTHTQPAYIYLHGEKVCCGVLHGSMIETLPLNRDEQIAQLTAAIEYQNSLTQQGKPRKRKA